jgi:hypothetical protein
MNKEANSSIIQNQAKDQLLRPFENDELKNLKAHLQRNQELSGEELFNMLKTYCENITEVYEIDILDENVTAWI